jgi:hypothetical protein
MQPTTYIIPRDANKMAKRDAKNNRKLDVASLPLPLPQAAYISVTAEPSSSTPGHGYAQDVALGAIVPTAQEIRAREKKAKEMRKAQKTAAYHSRIVQSRLPMIHKACVNRVARLHYGPYRCDHCAQDKNAVRHIHWSNTDDPTHTVCTVCNNPFTVPQEYEGVPVLMCVGCRTEMILCTTKNTKFGEKYVHYKESELANMIIDDNLSWVTYLDHVCSSKEQRVVFDGFTSASVLRTVIHSGKTPIPSLHFGNLQGQAYYVVLDNTKRVLPEPLFIEAKVCAAFVTQPKSWSEVNDALAAYRAPQFSIVDSDNDSLGLIYNVKIPAVLVEDSADKPKVMGNRM